MEKILSVLFTFVVMICLTLVILGIFYDKIPKTEKQDITETTVIELNKVE